MRIIRIIVLLIIHFLTFCYIFYSTDIFTENHNYILQSMYRNEYIGTSINVSYHAPRTTKFELSVHALNMVKSSILTHLDKICFHQMRNRLEIRKSFAGFQFFYSLEGNIYLSIYIGNISNGKPDSIADLYQFLFQDFNQ